MLSAVSVPGNGGDLYKKPHHDADFISNKMSGELRGIVIRLA